MKVFRDLPLLDLGIFFSTVAWARHFNESAIDDVTTLHFETACIKQFVEPVEQKRFEFEVLELFGKEPDCFRIGNGIAPVESEKVLKGKPISNLLFGLLVGEVVHGF